MQILTGALSLYESVYVFSLAAAGIYGAASGRVAPTTCAESHKLPLRMCAIAIPGDAVHAHTHHGVVERELAERHGSSVRVRGVWRIHT